VDLDSLWRRTATGRIPEEEKGLHASGHACGPDLLRVAGEIQPQVLIPVHSENPEFYVDNLAGSGMDNRTWHVDPFL
jgi:mRNA degradation ribonuclease J1/J2